MAMEDDGCTLNDGGSHTHGVRDRYASMAVRVPPSISTSKKKGAQRNRKKKLQRTSASVWQSLRRRTWATAAPFIGTLGSMLRTTMSIVGRSADLLVFSKSDESQAQGKRKMCLLHPTVLKHRCKICGGKGICTHGIRKDECTECVSVERMINSNRWCRICLTTHLGPERRNKGITICAQCDGEKRPRTEEVVRALLLPLVHFPPSLKDDTVMGGTTCESSGGGFLRRPDLAWFGTDRALFVEIDENGGHPSRTSTCELGKLWDQTSYIKTRMGERTVVKMIRFNPDEMVTAAAACDATVPSLEERVAHLAERINLFLSKTKEEVQAMEWRSPHLEYLFYHPKCYFHIDAARQRPESLVVSYVTPSLSTQIY